LINDVKEISNLEKFLKKNKILILGYYMENIFFFKKDFNIKQTEKEYLFYSLKNRLVNFSFLNKKIISNIKFLSIKLILLLKKNIELNK
jgi:hydroxymethylpyrimidine pyrophosphatase-like HAD family hydrolase